MHLDCIALGATGEQADQFSSGGTQRNWVLTRVCRFMSQVLQMKCDRRRMELLEAAAHEEPKCHTHRLCSLMEVSLVHHMEFPSNIALAQRDPLCIYACLICYSMYLGRGKQQLCIFHCTTLPRRETLESRHAGTK